MKKENHKMKSSDLKEFSPKKIKYILFKCTIIVFSCTKKDSHTINYEILVLKP